ncbi:enoyl-CoA hydratase [Metapseudomonas resinovorans]|uniref:Enoyl-CoA hydratase/isomerase family protein n=2 Tax=Metapseudomonas resinovorans TaxID=53412 RepID=S6ANC5_METRE|nr:enoyl-CoA hydratase [Pseudomonas resinovorans]BAH79710.1 enoyl-CoA hydratase [Pseudomonas resinovorans]BAN47073.1 enoyl-CoA hydratase/isomerase family protein [Pseudomonas resinovorans NBRC 106553]
MNPQQPDDEVVRYEVQGPVALVTMQRPEYHNAQNSRMTYALDAAFRRACDDDEVKVIVLRGAGRHFSAGHDIGTPERDIHQSFDRASLWYDHVNKPGGEFLYAREQEVYLGMCRRWRDIPKPTIAMVQGACIAGGLMLAWVCDLIVASDDAYFADPVVRMGIPGVEYFAHVHELNPRIAKEFLFLGERMGAERAYQMGMVNKVVPRDVLEDVTLDMARRVAQMPRLGLQLTKQAVNNAEDLMGKRATMDMVFGLHHFAHAHNELVSGDRLGGYDARGMADSQRRTEA